VRGWSVIEGWPEASLVDALAEAARAYDAASRTRPAGLGRADERVVDESTRIARLRWLSETGPAERAYLAAAEAMRLALNARLFLGLFELEAGFAIYPPGGFYARHVDSLKGARNRIVSVVTYLNRGWRAEDGGALTIWGRDGALAAEILPEAGVSVFMLSEEIAHEVRETRALRLAIAGWWRVNEGV
jgi:SM-20-related protein